MPVTTWRGSNPAGLDVKTHGNRSDAGAVRSEQSTVMSGPTVNNTYCMCALSDLETQGKLCTVHLGGTMATQARMVVVHVQIKTRSKKFCQDENLTQVQRISC